MNNKFNVGDLALTIYPLPAIDAGSVVSLEKRLDVGCQFTLYGISFRALQVGWLCSKPGIESPLAYAETSLMPLRGDFAPTVQKSLEVVA